MDTQTMKVMSLQQALASEIAQGDSEKRGSIEVTNFNETWKMACQCYRLTDFTFYMYRKTDYGSWHPSHTISEQEAECFLRGAGLD